jgi:carbon-monoxide dehydrogenase medium subunit
MIFSLMGGSMKPAPFEYLIPDSLDAVLAILSEHGSDAKLLAGGQSLVPAMNFRRLQPRLLVDLNNLTELNYVQPTDGDLRIGAMTRESRLEHDPLVARWTPLMHEAVPHIAHPQIRNRGTLGGSLAHADPVAELPAVCVALDARMRIVSQAGERWVPAAEFFHGRFTTDLAPEGILVEVAFPMLPARTGWSFLEVARRYGDRAMMGLAVLVTLDESDVCQHARLVYLNAGDRPVNAAAAAQVLQNEAASPAVFEAAATLAAEQEIDPRGGIHTSAAYQRHLAKILTQRALEQAFDRARQHANESV